MITGIPLFIGTLLIGRKADFFQNLGLNKSITKGFLFAFVCTLPMYIGFSIIFKFNPNIQLNTILIGVVSAGFFEELYYRGFLFGLPFKKTKLGFILSVLFGALYFGSLHLYQSSEPNEIIGYIFDYILGWHTIRLGICRVEFQHLGSHISAYANEFGVGIILCERQRTWRNLLERIPIFNYWISNYTNCILQKKKWNKIGCKQKDTFNSKRNPT